MASLLALVATLLTSFLPLLHKHLLRAARGRSTHMPSGSLAPPIASIRSPPGHCCKRPLWDNVGAGEALYWAHGSATWPRDSAAANLYHGSGPHGGSAAICSSRRTLRP